MMTEADKVLNQLENEDEFQTFSENLYTNYEQANKIRGITRLQILRGVTKNYLNFKEKHSRNINNDPEVLKVKSPRKKTSNPKFRLNNSSLYYSKNIRKRTDGTGDQGKNGMGQDKAQEDQTPLQIMLNKQNSANNKLYKIYADEYDKILVN